VVLEREEGHAGRPHGRLHVDPGGVGPLGHGVVTLVEDLVEDLQALVGQADLVGVGIDEQPRHGPGIVDGDLRPQFSTDVAGRLGDLGQQGSTWGQRDCISPDILGQRSRRAGQGSDLGRQPPPGSAVVVVVDPEVARGGGGGGQGDGSGLLDQGAELGGFPAR
jgi:hypothetical protein